MRTAGLHSATAPTGNHRTERLFNLRGSGRFAQNMVTPTDANLVPGLIPRRLVGAPAPYRGSTLSPTRFSVRRDGRRRSAGAPRLETCEERAAILTAARGQTGGELAAPGLPQEVAVARADVVRVGVKLLHGGLLPLTT